MGKIIKINPARQISKVIIASVKFFGLIENVVFIKSFGRFADNLNQYRSISDRRQVGEEIYKLKSYIKTCKFLLTD
jgi:hypothetical protein